MTSFFHDLEEQLRSAARRQTSGAGEASPDMPVHSPPPRRRWRWLAGGARALPVAVAVAVTLAVVVGALVLHGHRGGQSPTPPASGGGGNAFATLILKTPKAQLQRELALMGAATKTVQRSAACRVAQPRTAPQIHGVPGQALLSTLGALRRPASAADRRARGSISVMGPGVAVYAGAARRVATIAGTRYYIVPIRQDPAAGVPSRRCFALQKAVLVKALPTFPEALRRADPPARGFAGRLRHEPGRQATGRRDLRIDARAQRRWDLVRRDLRPDPAGAVPGERQRHGQRPGARRCLHGHAALRRGGRTPRAQADRDRARQRLRRPHRGHRPAHARLPHRRLARRRRAHAAHLLGDRARRAQEAVPGEAPGVHRRRPRRGFQPGGVGEQQLVQRLGHRDGVGPSPSIHPQDVGPP